MGKVRCPCCFMTLCWDRPKMGYVLTVYCYVLMQFNRNRISFVVLSAKHGVVHIAKYNCAKILLYEKALFLVLNTNQNATICMCSSVNIIYTVWFRNLFKLWHYHYQSCWHLKWNRESFSRLPFDVPKYQPYPVQRYSYRAPDSTLLEEEMTSKSFDSN